MNKTTIVAATVALSAAALGLAFWLSSAKQADSIRIDTSELPTPNPPGHPTLDKFEKTRVDFAHKDRIGAIQTAIDKATKGSDTQ